MNIQLILSKKLHEGGIEFEKYIVNSHVDMKKKLQHSIRNRFHSYIIDTMTDSGSSSASSTFPGNSASGGGCGVSV